MSISESLKATIESKIEQWEKELEIEKQKLEKQRIDSEAEFENNKLKQKVAEQVESNVIKLKSKIKTAKDEIKEAISA